MSEDPTQLRKEQLRDEMRRLSECADALERILPAIAEAQTIQRLRDEIASCRLQAARLSDRIRDSDSDSSQLSPIAWSDAGRAFQVFRSSLPGLIDEDLVDEYHQILDSLEGASRLDLSEFRIDDTRLSFRVVQSRSAGAFPPLRVQYSNKRYCDGDYFQATLARLDYFLRRSNSEPAGA